MAFCSRQPVLSGFSTHHSHTWHTWHTLNLNDLSHSCNISSPIRPSLCRIKPIAMVYWPCGMSCIIADHMVRLISKQNQTGRCTISVTYFGSSRASFWFRRSFNLSTSANRFPFASCSKTTWLHTPHVTTDSSMSDYTLTNNTRFPYMFYRKLSFHISVQFTMNRQMNTQ